MSTSRDVVIVAFHFPPQGGAGSLRLLSFVRHLPEHGWQPRVVTLGDLGERLTDPTLSSRVPSHVDVQRWFTPLADWAYRRTSSDRKTAGSMARRVLRRVLEPIAYPDPAIAWSLATGWRLGKRFRENPPAVLLTSAPPHSVHAAGLVASAVAGVPWVIDLRDPWLGAGLRGRAGRFLERSAIAEAACVLANTPRVAEALMSLPRPPRRVVVLPNGYDADEIRLARERVPERNGDAFTIVHAGALYAGHRDPLDFLEVLARARETQRGSRKVRFVIAGDSSFHRNPRLSERIRALRLDSVVESPGYLSHEGVLALMASADLLLLIQGEGFKLQVPSKAYEYLALGRPVLALTSEGATADLVRSSQVGTVIAPGDREELLRHLLAAMARSSPLEPAVPPVTVSSRSEIAARLAQVLDEVKAEVTLN